jgi:hypothetical protein
MAERGHLPGGWAWDETTLRAAARRIADLAVDHLVMLPERPVFTPGPGGLADRWRAEQWAADGALKSAGRDGYRRLIEHDLDLADQLAARVREHPSPELDAAGLSVVCFRYRASEDSDRVQSDIAQRIQLSGESFLTTTELDGRTVLRACSSTPSPLMRTSARSSISSSPRAR